MATATSGSYKPVRQCELQNSRLSRLSTQPRTKKQKLGVQTRGPRQHSSVHCQRLHIVAGATESSQQTPPSVQDLKAELQDAIRLEAYGRAADIRDALKSLETSDPTLLKEQLEECVAEERYMVCSLLLQHSISLHPMFQRQYPTVWRQLSLHACVMQDAAELRDKLRHVVQQKLEDAKQRTTSDTVTEDIRVQVKR